LPILLSGSAVANDKVTDGMAAGDVVGVVLVVNAFKAGEARGRESDVKGRVVKGLCSGREGNE
jgi:hypothetical protein